MRDNVYICTVLGVDVTTVARRQAQVDLRNQGVSCVDLLATERDRVQRTAFIRPHMEKHKDRMKNPLLSSTTTEGFLSRTQTHALVHAILGTTWGRGGAAGGEDDGETKQTQSLEDLYDYRVAVHATNGRELYGRMELQEYLDTMLCGLTNVYISCDQVTRIPYLDGAGTDIAVRWTLTAIHSGTHATLGLPTQCPVYILAASHYRVLKGRVREEWTVFDELALHRQVETQRLLMMEKNNAS
jgi:hypothetical protein